MRRRPPQSSNVADLSAVVGQTFTKNLPDAGEHVVQLDPAHRALLYVPRAALHVGPVAIAVMLHGAGGRADGMRFVYPAADEHGVVILAPESLGRTWDVIVGEYGPDVMSLDRALAAAFAQLNVDRGRVAIGGFSDGASYALSIGLANGHLFTHILALSPGFMAPPLLRGQPKVFISHGVHDDVLRIDMTSRKLAPQLTELGYDLTYREFDGPHVVPEPVLREAFAILGSNSHSA